MKYLSIILLAAALPALPASALAASQADAQRQADVAVRGADVMPFDLAKTTHIFTKTPTGGIQRVVAKDSADAVQVGLVREHLRDIQTRFSRGDFAGPAHIHGAGMPGLPILRTAKPGELTIVYRDVDGGGELEYQARTARLTNALHQWFDAQLSDHGKDAIEGHAHHHH